GYLIGKQNPDGGFGEHHESCMAKRWLGAESTPTQTAWVLMTLCRSGLAGTTAARRAADYLVRTQQPDGDWPTEPVLGVFNKSTLIRYDNYRRYFTVRALAEYAQGRDGWSIPAV
ncbi:MAG: squalene--hopene cyclase, partial [Deltaproteobacteria bacterium]